ncbi:hypothetical protein F4553_001064 [Allocatelliglobosispora scoriae]|uniref:Uncharacterized protein n=1 Tax=Allocatelliglobosispora scoriae TaxID=643052 RepID=A0A841BJ87_9ACTN|nr:hypothetical protein [Allocatelliglobosispora scoriae]MBB5867685.1 hypothetical protein [Allocatelliglobosispora scoriae]
MVDDGDGLAGSLAAALAELSFADLDADQVTALLIDTVVAWGEAAGWRVYRRARSVMTLPPPYADRHSWVDVACARAGAAPVVVEVDHADRRRTIDKLTQEAQAGRVALWVRWGSPPFAEPPPPVRLVACPVVTRRGGGKQSFSSPQPELPAPSHSGPGLDAGEQPDLFGGVEP